MFAIREGKWKLILGNGSGARTKPVGAPFQQPYQLCDLEDDLAESNNIIEEQTAVAEKLEADFFKIHGNDQLVQVPVYDGVDQKQRSPN